MVTTPFHRSEIIVYPSRDQGCGSFVAHCLNMDLIADDDTVEGAVSNLLHTIEAALEAGEKHTANVFRDAPQEYWDMLSRAKPLPQELMERITRDANKRHHPDRAVVDIEHADIRQLETAT